MPMNRTLTYVVLAAVVAVLLALAWRGESPPDGEAKQANAQVGENAGSASGSTPGSAPPRAGSEIDTLHRRLDAEIRARRELEGEVEALRRQVAELQDRAESNAVDAQLKRSQAAAADASDDSANAWFDEQSLIAAGMDGVLAAELKAFFERLELERLQLRDRAAREGWDRARRREELDALDQREQSLRERLGEQGYDAYLYAAGRPNRVAVTSVLESAPAGQAGIQPGDYILRYDRERIYNWTDLRAATSAGNLSEMVEIEVERDGETLQFYLARGPLGVRMDSRSVAP